MTGKAAQEQALNTRLIEAGDPIPDSPETVQHITAGYQLQAGTAYFEYHSCVAGILCRNIYTVYGLEVLGSQGTKPPKVIKYDNFLWDFQIQPDKMLMAN